MSVSNSVEQSARRPNDRLDRRELSLGILLIAGGVFGLVASFALTMDKFLLLEQGAALSGKVLFPHWFLAAFTFGMFLAISFVGWLATQSIWVLHTLCPWCSLVYVAVIPMSLAVTLFSLKERCIPSPVWLQRAAGRLYLWVPLISLVIYVVIAVTAQLNLNLLGI